MRVLGIESSCDETAAAVVEDGTYILSSVVASQVHLHAATGGVVPEVASRQHLLQAIPLVDQAMTEAGTNWSDLAAVAVTIGPGLAGSLIVGVNLAKAMAFAQGLPLVGVNHLEGHIYANWLASPDGGLPAIPDFPLLCLIVSGGHTDLILMHGHGDYQRLGETKDDAAGEAFDKVARLLFLGYPGGPAIERAAALGRAEALRLPRPWLRGSDDFSFSGLKTAVRQLVEKRVLAQQPLSSEYGGEPLLTADIAAAFQEAVVEVLVGKTVAAAKREKAQGIVLSGGVAANTRLRQVLTSASPLPVLVPPPALCTDNAAMVAACGYFRFRAGQRDSWKLDVHPDLRLG